MRISFVVTVFLFSCQLVSLAQNPPQPPATPPQAPTPVIQQETEFNTIVMKSTFEIQNVPGQQPSLGTAFIIGRPLKSNPNMSRYVLVTAGHVLEGISGDVAILNLRKQTPQGDWQKVPWVVQIRNNRQPLWTKRPSADVAVMYLALGRNDMVVFGEGRSCEKSALGMFCTCGHEFLPSFTRFHSRAD